MRVTRKVQYFLEMNSNRIKWSKSTKISEINIFLQKFNGLFYFPIKFLHLVLNERSKPAPLRPPIPGARQVQMNGQVQPPDGQTPAVGHDTSLFSKLVLGCIDSYDSEKWRIFSHFSRSTRFSHFRTAPNSKFQENSSFLSKSCEFSEILQILLKFREKVSEICWNFAFRAVRKCENRVDLEKCEKMRHFSLS